MSRFKFGILGGDFRYKILFDMFKKDGYSVKAYCNKCIGDDAASLGELLDGADVLIAPIPCTKDNEHIFLTDCCTVKIDKLMEDMYRNDVKLFLGGVVTNKIVGEAVKYNIKTFDFFEREAVAVRNAIPTAEGAIQTAMEESDRTIFGSRCLILGYGRCGKILSNMLKGLGADVSVTYRNERDAAYIKSYGYKEINLYELKSYAEQFDFIFNTIPAHVVDKEIIKKLRKNCVIIDLAQAPGGVDFNFARDVNIKALYCPGLPGRVAPYTAAEILKEAVLNISLEQIPSV